MAKKTWREKLLDKKDLPKVVVLKENAQKHLQASTMAIPSPMEVYDIMARVPKGKLITIEEIRKIIALKHKADIGCPLTCGIFSWIAAHAAVEEAAEGKRMIMPYWRTLKANGVLKAEGYSLVQKGQKFVVMNYEKYLLNDS
jgi:6-O-methylguanine DNA methyltransferase, DNA binding domain